LSRDIKPLYSKTLVTKAGDRVRSNTMTDEDVKIIENWRASHNHILNSWQATLRGRIGDKNIVFAQRLKRRNTIFDKLSREAGMQLARMHDIAGCRLIFEDITTLEAYRSSLHKARMNHTRKKSGENPYRYDYIAKPAESGYRGIHDIYEYQARNNRKKDWDGLQVELQYRTIYQHAWATAVEVAGDITGNQPKFNRGDERHQEFFRLASEIIARSFENRISCKASMTNKEIIEAFEKLEAEIGLLRALKNLRVITKHITTNKKNVILIMPKDQDKSTTFFAYDTLPEATKDYFILEKKHAEDDVVLVRSESGANIKNAFRNYFSDAQDFVKLIDVGLKNLRTTTT
jgi:ppGpp synthetase/RelA/SpoT-type nucleotidyltranferase